MAKRYEHPPLEEVEVIMKRIMTYQEYISMRSQAVKKGWKINAYQKGFYNDTIKQSKIINDENQKSES